MFDHLWSVILSWLFGLTSISGSPGCGWQGCRHFLDTDFKPIVYAIDRDGLRSYAVGTFHATISRARIPRLILNAVDWAPTFVSELDQEDPFPMDLLVDQRARTLRQRLSSAAWLRLNEIFPTLDRLPPTVRPMVVYRMYTEKVLATAFDPVEPMHLLEVHLIRRARAAGKSVHALSRHREVVQTLGAGVSSELLEWTTRSLDPEAISEAYRTERAAFREGDVGAVFRAYRHAHRELRTQHLFNRLVRDRNASFVPRLIEWHARGPFVLAIGAVHLGGEFGLVNLLGAAGFKVRRLD